MSMSRISGPMLLGTLAAVFLSPLAAAQEPPRPEDVPSRSELRAIRSAKIAVAASPDRERVVHLSDTTFFEALDPSLPALAEVRTLAAGGNLDAAWQAFERFFAQRPAGDDLRRVDRARTVGRGELDGKIRRQADDLVTGVVEARGFRAELGTPHDWRRGAGLNAFAAVHSWGWSTALWQAYLATGEARYVRAFTGLFRSWHAQRETISQVTDFDPIWYELNVGGRGIHLLRCLRAFGDHPELPPSVRRRVWTQILGEVNHLHALELCGYNPGNWQVLGGHALYRLGHVLSFFTDASSWRATAKQRLIEHVFWDYNEDGGHSERTFGYSMGLLHRFHDLMRSSRDDPHATDFRKAVAARLSTIESWFLNYTTPSGVFIGVNDSSFESSDGLLSHLAQVTRDGRFLWTVRHRPELHQGLTPVRPELRSVHLAVDGWTMMRDGWDRKSFFGMINWGPHAGSHSHEANLDVNLYALGEPLVIEGGSLGYDSSLDPWIRSPDAHNQVVIEGRTFERLARPARVIVWASGKKIDVFEAHHDRYRRSADTRMRRRVLFVKGEYWLVIDTVQVGANADGPLNAALVWHARDAWEPRASSSLDLLSRREGHPGTQLLVRPGSATVELSTAYEDEPDLHGSRYTARFRAPARGTRFLSLIAPFEEQPVDSSLTLKEVSGGLQITVRRDAITDHVFLRTAEGTNPVGDRLETDGRIAWVRETTKRGAVVLGSLLRWDGAPLISHEQRGTIHER